LSGHGFVKKSVGKVGENIKAERLVVALADWSTSQRPVYAFYQRSRYMAPRIRVLLDFLVERFAVAVPEMANFLAVG